MKYPVTAFGIIQALKMAECFCSEYEIAVLANIDTTSENLRQIKEEMFDFVESGSVEFRVKEWQSQTAPLKQLQFRFVS
jgi:hypothetical protein